LLLALYPDVHFAMFGEGVLLVDCRKYVESWNLSERVFLPGLTSNPWSALSAMDIFVLPSRMEGLPNVLIEAQAMSLPVVCTGAGGMAETFVEGETGYSVPSASAKELAAAVARLVTDPALRRRMGDAAAIHARENFGIDRMIQRTIKAYKDAPVYIRPGGPAGPREYPASIELSNI
jgi:glycosyltransferase involved in cell wall biosynthesis